MNSTRASDQTIFLISVDEKLKMRKNGTEIITVIFMIKTEKILKKYPKNEFNKSQQIGVPGWCSRLSV